ncbi:MAG: hypothetical protein QM831_20490 [Kofleriaceae bacterium]
MALGVAPKARAQPEKLEGEDKTGTEVGVFPLVGGDTDNGFGAGAIGSIANFDGKDVPYHYQLQFATFIATKGSPISPSYEDAYLNLIIPQTARRPTSPRNPSVVHARDCAAVLRHRQQHPDPEPDGRPA